MVSKEHFENVTKPIIRFVCSELESNMFHFWKSHDDGENKKDKLANAEPVECEVVE